MNLNLQLALYITSLLLSRLLREVIEISQSVLVENISQGALEIYNWCVYVSTITTEKQCRNRTFQRLLSFFSVLHPFQTPPYQFPPQTTPSDLVDDVTHQNDRITTKLSFTFYNSSSYRRHRQKCYKLGYCWWISIIFIFHSDETGCLYGIVRTFVLGDIYGVKEKNEQISKLPP